MGLDDLELDALGDELDFEDEEIPSYLQEDPVDLPKAAETDPSKKVSKGIRTHNHDANSTSALSSAGQCATRRVWATYQCRGSVEGITLGWLVYLVLFYPYTHSPFSYTFNLDE
jgi:hypothetical protein